MPPRVELRSLTGLRFVAAALVVVHHVAAAVGAVPVASAVASLGFVGVTFFFVLSGFVLTWSADPALARRHFYGRRFARVYPTHLATLVVAILMALLLHRTVDLETTLVDVPLLHAWAPAPAYTETLNSVSWSLSDEMFFYALFPFLLVALSRRRPTQVWACGGALLALTVLSVPALRLLLSPELAGNVLYKSPALRTADFLVGVALALTVRSGWRPRVSFAAAAVLAVGTYVVLALGLAVTGHTTILRAVPDLILLGPLALLIATAACSDIDGRESGRRSWIASDRLVLLGKSSFQLYMTHFLLLAAVVAVVPRVTRTVGAGALGVIIAFTALAVVVSIVTFRIFEVPTERWLRHRLGGPSRRSPARPEIAATLEP